MDSKTHTHIELVERAISEWNTKQLLYENDHGKSETSVNPLKCISTLTTDKNCGMNE